MRSLFAFLTLLTLQLIVAPLVTVATEVVSTAQADELVDSGLDDTGYLEPELDEGEEEEVATCPFLEAHPFMACPYLAAIHAGCPHGGGEVTESGAQRSPRADGYIDL
jgi:hypothetical protein